jgi:toxin ParE1/3/4
VKVRYTLSALADLEAILDYVTEQSPQGANRIKARIQAIERLLAQHPLSGARTRLPWLRRITVSPYPYLIFYEATDSEAIIHAVRHSARDPSSIPGSA